MIDMVHPDDYSLEEMIVTLSSYPRGEFIYETLDRDGRAIYHFAKWTATEQMIRDKYQQVYDYETNAMEEEL